MYTDKGRELMVDKGCEEFRSAVIARISCVLMFGSRLTLKKKTFTNPRKTNMSNMSLDKK